MRSFFCSKPAQKMRCKICHFSFWLVFNSVGNVGDFIFAVVRVKESFAEFRERRQVNFRNRVAQNSSESLCFECWRFNFAEHYDNMCARAIPPRSCRILEKHKIYRAINICNVLKILFLIVKPFGNFICRNIAIFSQKSRDEFFLCFNTLILEFRIIIRQLN